MVGYKLKSLAHAKLRHLLFSFTQLLELSYHDTEDIVKHWRLLVYRLPSLLDFCLWQFVIVDQEVYYRAKVVSRNTKFWSSPSCSG